MKKIILVVLSLFCISLWSNEKKVIIQLALDDLPAYFDDNHSHSSYLVKPWPFQKNPHFLVEPQTDFYYTYPVDRHVFAFFEEEVVILDRISHLWGGNLGITLTLSENDLEYLEDEKYYKDLFLFLCHSFDMGYFSAINWDLNFSRNRTDHSLILRLFNDLIQYGKNQLKMVYSLDRFTKPIEEISSFADYIIVKSYDNSGRHSTLENAEEAIVTFIKRRGIEPSRLILAIPLYGRKFRSYDPGYWTEIIPYSSIINNYNPSVESNEVDFYYFNGKVLTTQKKELITKKELAGTALIPINWDAQGNRSLLDVFKIFQ